LLHRRTSIWIENNIGNVAVAVDLKGDREGRVGGFADASPSEKPLLTDNSEGVPSRL